jgi:uncharacterized membrane protein YoaK (UPF0700 family)
MTAAAHTRSRSLSAGLSFVAGCVDTLGFVALFGLFTAHVTGNFVLIGSVLAQSAGNVLLKLLVFPAFIAAVAATRLMVLRLERKGSAPLRPLLLLQSLLLASFALCGWWGMPIHNDEAPMAMWAGILGASAMGVQNAAARLVLPTLTPSTVMTGNVTQLVIDLVDLLRGTADPALRERALRFVWPILAFGLGAVAGAFGYVRLGFAALLLPLLVLLLLAYRERTTTAPV